MSTAKAASHVAAPSEPFSQKEVAVFPRSLIRITCAVRSLGVAFLVLLAVFSPRFASADENGCPPQGGLWFGLSGDGAFHRGLWSSWSTNQATKVLTGDFNGD